MAVLDPVKLVITNWGELMGGDDVLDDCSAPVHPHHPERGERDFKLGREVWIERTDYEDVQPKGFFRLFPGNKVRLKYGHTIECTGGTTRCRAASSSKCRPRWCPTPRAARRARTRSR